MISSTYNDTTDYLNTFTNLFPTMFNSNKPYISFNYAPNVFLLNSANTTIYNLSSTEFANNYITTITAPIMTTLTTRHTSYTANIILGNINIPSSSSIFNVQNQTTNDFYKLVMAGNVKINTINLYTLAQVLKHIWIDLMDGVKILFINLF
mgnify:CR=1 FL=1